MAADGTCALATLDSLSDLELWSVRNLGSQWVGALKGIMNPSKIVSL